MSVEIRCLGGRPSSCGEDPACWIQRRSPLGWRMRYRRRGTGRPAAIRGRTVVSAGDPRDESPRSRPVARDRAPHGKPPKGSSSAHVEDRSGSNATTKKLREWRQPAAKRLFHSASAPAAAPRALLLPGGEPLSVHPRWGSGVQCVALIQLRIIGVPPDIIASSG